MNTNTHSITPAPATVTFSQRSLWIAGAAALAAAGAIAAVVVMRQSPAAEPAVEPVAAQSVAALQGPAPDDGVPPPNAATQTPKPSAAAHTATKVAQAHTEQPAPAHAAVCAACGTVESVQTVTTKGQSSGVGAVAGGVIGGVLGNQVGGGNGRKAMTVLGAVGGGLAGNELEKRHNATTSYKVTIKKDDGSHVTLTRSEPWSVGTRVSVEGTTLKAL